MQDLGEALFGAEVPELRRAAFAIAYRMLGSVAESEDVVQEALLRLYRAEREGVAVESVRAYLASVTTRLCIDHLRSARVRRETYPGPWLPEPVVEQNQSDPARRIETAESVSMAFLVLLESLSPTERAVFLLRQVFDFEYSEIAEITGKSEPNCRQIFTRAKRHVDERKPRFETSSAKRDQVAQSFFEACANGDLDALMNILAEDATFIGDGGGKALATTQPVRGNRSVGRLLLGLINKGKARGVHLEPAEVNGQPGAVGYDGQNRLINVIALDIAGGKVVAIRSVVNPDKLRHLGPLSELTRLPRKTRPAEPGSGGLT